MVGPPSSWSRDKKDAWLQRAARLVGARLPQGLRLGDLLVVGVAASIGFTVSLCFATAAFPEGTALAETKMGALSFAAVPLAFVVSRSLRIKAAAAHADGIV